MTPSWSEIDFVKEFPFDGVYARSASPHSEDVSKKGQQSTKRKRRGLLWHACFSQPLADEPPVAATTSHASPSRLTLTSQQLQYRRTGSPETQLLPLSSIKDVQFRWIEVGGVRVSKVTITLDSGKDPMVIRGLKNPEDLVDAVRQQQQTALGGGRLKQPQEETPPGLTHDPDGQGQAGTPGRPWSEKSHSPAKLMTPRALFADATGSPPSAAVSGCGSMTMLSAFARSPAQGFTGAQSVAREIQLASPGRADDSSYSGLSAATSASGTPESSSPAVDAIARASPGCTAAAAASGLVSRPEAKGHPPPQAASLFALPPTASMTWRSVGAVQARASGSGVTSHPHEEQLAGLLLAKHSPRGPARPPARDLARHSVAGDEMSGEQLTTAGSLRAAPSPLMGGSPPLLAEDSLPDGGSGLTSLRGSSGAPLPAPMCIVGGSPPPVPEDSLVYGGSGSTPVSPLSATYASFAGGRPGLHGAAVAADTTRSASLQPVHAAARAPAGGRSGGGVTRSNSASAGSVSISPPAGHAAGRELPSDVIFCTKPPHLEALARESPDFVAKHADTAAALDGSRSGTGSSSCSPGPTPRLLSISAGTTKQRRSHRLSHNSRGAQPALSPHGGNDAPHGDAARPTGLSDGGGTAFHSARSGELAETAGTTTEMVPAAPVPAGVSNAPTRAIDIAAVSATVSAVLTSAATASLSSMGLSAMPPVAGAAGSAAARSAATASVAAPPLMLLGITAAAAVTLVAAAAVTRIRAGSPLRLVDNPCSGLGPWNLAPAPATEPLQARGDCAGAQQAAEAPAPRLDSHRSCEESACAGAPESKGGTDTADLSAAEPRQTTKQIAIIAATAASGDGPDEEPESVSVAVTAADQGIRPVNAMPASEYRGGSATGGEGGMELALMGCRSAPGAVVGGVTACNGGSQDDAVGGVTACSGGSQDDAVGGVTACSGGSQDDAGTIGAWTSQPTLSDLNLEQPVRAMHAGVLRLPSPPAARDGALAVPPGSHGDGVLPVAGRSCDAGQARPTAQQHPSLQRDPAARRLFSHNEDSGALYVAASDPIGSPHQMGREQQQHFQEGVKEPALAYSSNAPVIRALFPVGAVTTATASAAPATSPQSLLPAVASTSPSSRRRRAQHLTESPVRVLYSVHTAFTGQPLSGARVQNSPAPPTTCESAAQTEGLLADCGLQTEVAAAVGGARSSGAGEAAQPLAASAVQRVYSLSSPPQVSSGGRSAVSVASGADRLDSREAAPRQPKIQAGAQDWYLSSVGADTQLGGGFKLGALAAGDCSRCRPSFSESTADSAAAYDSSCMQGSTPGTSPAAAGSGLQLPRAALSSATVAAAAFGIDSAIAAAATLLKGNGEPGLAVAATDGRASGLPPQQEVWQQLPGAAHTVGEGQAVSPFRSGMFNPQTPSSSASGDSSNDSGTVPVSVSVQSGLYTPMSSLVSRGSMLGNAMEAATSSSARGYGTDGPANAKAASATVGSVGVQQRLLAPGVALSAEPPPTASTRPSPWTQHRGDLGLAASAQASSPGESAAQGCGPGGQAVARDAASTLAAEPASPRSGCSDTAEEMVWLLGPAAANSGVASDNAAAEGLSAPDSPRIPPPPSIGHSSYTSSPRYRSGRDGGGSCPRRTTTETEDDEVVAARSAAPLGRCSSRGSSSGSCTGGPTAASRTCLAGLARGAAGQRSASGTNAQSRAARGAGTGSGSDGNQLATLLSSGACSSAPERQGAAYRAHGLSTTAGGSSDNMGNSSIASGMSPSSSRCGDRSRAAVGFGVVGPSAAALWELIGPAVQRSMGAAAKGNYGGVAGGGGGAVACSMGSPTATPAPRCGATSQSAAPSADLSDISSAAYAAGMYMYGSPATDTAEPLLAEHNARTEAAGTDASFGSSPGCPAAAAEITPPPAQRLQDDLFHNPLYSTLGKDAPGNPPLSQPPRDGSGCIALPLTPFSYGAIYGGVDGNGTGTSTCSSSPEPASTAQQRDPGSEVPSSHGRRRTRDDATMPSSHANGDGRGEKGESCAGTREARRTVRRYGSASGGGQRSGAATTVAATAAACRYGCDWVLFAADNAVETAGGSTEKDAQPINKRARTQLSMVASTPQRRRGAQPEPITPGPRQGGGGRKVAPGLPLVSPMLVLNPTYVRSANGSPAGSSPPPSTPDDDVSAKVKPVATAVTWAEPKGCGGGGGAKREIFPDADQQLQNTSLQTTPRRQDVARLQDEGLGSAQGSPSSQQAVQAAMLLRNANYAVDFAREAIQRGDTQWLARVTATLQAVQSALDALRDF